MAAPRVREREMTSYFYVRGGEQVGPVAIDRLKELAASGELAPDDLVWQEGTPDWREARGFDGLFPRAAAPPPTPPPIPVRPAPPQRGTAAEDAPPLPPPLSAGEWPGWSSLPALAREYGRKLGVELPALVALAAGVGCFLLLLLSTLLTWSSLVLTMNMMGMPTADGWAYSGLSVAEGKLVAVLVVLSLLLLGAGAVVRQLLPWAVVAAAAVSLCSVLLVVSHMHQASRVLSAARGEVAARRQMMNSFGGEFRQIADQIGQRVTGGAGGGTYLALLAALGATAAFVMAAVLRPQPLTFLPSGAVPPFVRRYGALAAALALAFLFGLVMWVARIDALFAG